MTQYYTYIYFDSERNFEPFYVGKGSSGRYKEHLRHAENQQLDRRIKKMIRENDQPEIEIINTTNEFAAFWLEKVAIKAFGRRDLGLGPLLNHTDGGDSGPPMNKETAKKVQASIKANGTFSPPPKITSKSAIKGAATRATNGFKPKPQKYWLGKERTDMKGNTFGSLLKGYRWITNDIENKKIAPNTEIPNGWHLGKLYRTRSAA